MADASRTRALAWIAALLCAPLASCGGKGITPVRTAFNRGVYLQSAGDDHGAMLEYREALREDPKDYRARFNLALSLEHAAASAPAAERAALCAQAESEYRTILEQRPGDLRSSINFAAMLSERGDYDAARRLLEEAISHHPSDSAPRTALAALELKEERAIDAEQTLREALRVEPASVEANFLLGECMVRLGRPEQAREAYERAIATRGDDIGSLLALGRLEMTQERILEAAAALQRVLLIDEDNFEAHLLLASAMERADDLEGAAYHLVRARRLDHQRSPGQPPVDYQAQLQGLYERLLARERSGP